VSALGDRTRAVLSTCADPLFATAARGVNVQSNYLTVKIYDWKGTLTTKMAGSVDADPRFDADGVATDDADHRQDSGAAILSAVRTIGARTDAYRRAVADAVDLGTADLVALSLLQRQEPQRASQIGEWTGLTAGSVTALLNRLEAGGYLTRMRPDHDRRSLEVCLTPAGRALGEAVINGLTPTMDRIAGELGPNGCRIVLTAFSKINAALDELAADPHLDLPDQHT
jgi:DNA-binding MarR family transcriptional regulator